MTATLFLINGGNHPNDKVALKIGDRPTVHCLSHGEFVPLNVSQGQSVTVTCTDINHGSGDCHDFKPSILMTEGPGFKMLRVPGGVKGIFGRIQALCVALINELHVLRGNNPECARLASIAITSVETANLFAEKAFHTPDPVDAKPESDAVEIRVGDVWRAKQSYLHRSHHLASAFFTNLQVVDCVTTEHRGVQVECKLLDNNLVDSGRTTINIAISEFRANCELVEREPVGVAANHERDQEILIGDVWKEKRTGPACAGFSISDVTNDVVRFVDDNANVYSASIADFRENYYLVHRGGQEEPTANSSPNPSYVTDG